MSLEVSYQIAYGFILTEEEANTFPLEQRQFLIEDGTLIPLSTWHDDADYAFVFYTEEVYEGCAVEIAAEYPVDDYEWNIFRTQFPYRAEELPKKLAFVQIS